MDKRKFTAKLNHTSKNVLRAIIPALGLHQRSERALTMKYIEEKCMWDIAEELGISYNSTGNFISVARMEMLDLMQNDYNIYSDEVKAHIDKLLK